MTSGLGSSRACTTGTGSVATLNAVIVHCTGQLGHGVIDAYEGVVILSDVDITGSTSNGAAIAPHRGRRHHHGYGRRHPPTHPHTGEISPCIPFSN